MGGGGDERETERERERERGIIEKREREREREREIEGEGGRKTREGATEGKGEELANFLLETKELLFGNLVLYD